jgi:pimeloyl-ACP methyl ester carboxylesterase
MQLAYQHPELLDRLILVGSGGLGREVSWLLRMLTLPGFDYVMPFGFLKPMVELGTAMGRFAGRSGFLNKRLGELWRGYSSLAGAPNRSAFVRTMRGVIEPGGQMVNATDRLYLAARVPTLLVWGDRDGIIPVEHAYAAHAEIGRSRLEIMDRLGHFPHVEDPERFAKVLIDFLLTTEAGPVGPEPLRDVILGNVY